MVSFHSKIRYSLQSWRIKKKYSCTPQNELSPFLQHVRCMRCSFYETRFPIDLLPWVIVLFLPSRRFFSRIG